MKEKASLTKFELPLNGASDELSMTNESPSLCVEYRERVSEIKWKQQGAATLLSLHVTVAIITLLVRVVQKVHQKGDQLSVLRATGLPIGTKVAMEHGLQGRSQLPQQIPRLCRQLPAHKRTARQGYFNTVISNWERQNRTGFCCMFLI